MCCFENENEEFGSDLNEGEDMEQQVMFTKGDTMGRMFP